jgi:hypothetical protein
MKLKDWITEQGDDAAAKILNMKYNRVKSYRLGNAQPKPKDAVKIVRKLKGLVSFEECFHI